MKRKEFVALINEDKTSFKKQVISLIEQQISKNVTDRYIKESASILMKIKCQPKRKMNEQVKEAPVVKKQIIPVKEINDALLSERTHWLMAKDGSQIEVTAQMAKYLAELYVSLNTLHKEKLVNLITESEHGFKKAVKTAQKLYRR